MADLAAGAKTRHAQLHEDIRAAARLYGQMRRHGGQRRLEAYRQWHRLLIEHFWDAHRQFAREGTPASELTAVHDTLHLER